MQYQDQKDISSPQCYNEEVLRQWYCADVSNSCSSLDISFDTAKATLLARGMALDDFNQLIGMLKAIAKSCIELEKRTITKINQ